MRCIITIQDFLQQAVIIQNIQDVTNNQNLFQDLGAKIWNSIPQELRKLPKYVFKKNIQNQLLQALWKRTVMLAHFP